jgi:hypothetical protein
MTIELIETKTLGTAAASIEFTSIPQDGTDLMLLFSHRSSGSTDGLQIAVRFNGLTSGYNTHQVFDELPGAYNGFNVSQTFGRFGWSQFSGSTSNTFASTSLYIPSYTQAFQKSYSSEHVTEGNTSLNYSRAFYAGVSTGTAAITSLNVFEQNSVNFVANTTASLYKITKGSDGIVTTS